MLNRGAVIVRPKDAFFEWAAGLDDSGLAPDPGGEQTVYLIPACDDEDDAWEILEEIYDEIFQAELDGWHTDPTDWPQGRTLETFCEWFDVEFHSVVEDMCRYEIRDEDDQ